jgi:hypothetical protein
MKNVAPDGVSEDGWFEDGDALVCRGIPTTLLERGSHGQVDGFYI